MNSNSYNSILIIGMGLIGSSIARVIKEKKIAKKIYAIDKNKRHNLK
jgi:Prephenate dehydrogenase